MRPFATIGSGAAARQAAAASGDSPLYLIPILSIAVQAGLIVHVIKTGRNIAVDLGHRAAAAGRRRSPMSVVELLPELFGGRTARRARAGMQRMIDPDRDLRRASAEVEISGNVDARRRLAEELLERSQYDAAMRRLRRRPERHFRARSDIAAGLGAGAIRQAGLRRGARGARAI